MYAYFRMAASAVQKKVEELRHHRNNMYVRPFVRNNVSVCLT